MTTCSNCGRSAGTIQKGRTLYCAFRKNNLAGCPSPEEIAEQARRMKEVALEQMWSKGRVTARILEGTEA